MISTASGATSATSLDTASSATSAPPLTEKGERARDGTMEAEANFLAGSLLIPNEAAVYILRQQLVSVGQGIYGVSYQMLEFRLRVAERRRYTRATSRQQEAAAGSREDDVPARSVAEMAYGDERPHARNASSTPAAPSAQNSPTPPSAHAAPEHVAATVRAFNRASDRVSQCGLDNDVVVGCRHARPIPGRRCETRGPSHRAATCPFGSRPTSHSRHGASAAAGEHQLANARQCFDDFKRGVAQGYKVPSAGFHPAPGTVQTSSARRYATNEAALAGARSREDLEL
jgi:hypothetical protein